MRKRRIGTAKFFTLLLLLYHTSANARSFKRVYVNCDNNLLNLRGNGESWQVVLIDEEMKKRMFEDAE